MTMRDEIRDVIHSKLRQVCTEPVHYTSVADAILALMQGRLDEIREIANETGHLMNRHYTDIEVMDEMTKIEALCTLTEPEPEPDKREGTIRGVKSVLSGNAMRSDENYGQFCERIAALVVDRIKESYND